MLVVELTGHGDGRNNCYQFPVPNVNIPLHIYNGKSYSRAVLVTKVIGALGI